MKYNLSCDIVNDLLPSYVDHLTSEESNAAIKTHLDSCSDCAEVCSEMQSEIEESRIQINEKNLLLKSKRRLTKRVLTITVIVAVIVVLLASVFSLGWYAYWGRRHQLLYDIEYINVQPANENAYTVNIKGSAKQWFFDIRSHTFALTSTQVHGEPVYWLDNVQAEYITTKPGVSAEFEITATLTPYFEEDKAEHSEKDILSSLFQNDLVPVDEQGKTIENAHFYFLDYQSKIHQME